jgi:pathogenesis-related protein 1
MCVDNDAPAGLIDHSSGAYRSNVDGFAILGENIFGSGGAATAQQAVDIWASEKASFTYPTACSGTCGHYTQVVWRESTHLGCANVTCAGLAYGGTIVCEYGPAGNDGSAPY